MILRLDESLDLFCDTILEISKVEKGRKSRIGNRRRRVRMNNSSSPEEENTTEDPFSDFPPLCAKKSKNHVNFSFCYHRC